ncbi:MAG: putative phosphotransacetylase [Clostridia bacterium]|nr:putative phosphotransacetylase [Clostridia bacterium]
MDNELLIKLAASEVLKKLETMKNHNPASQGNNIPIGVSNRHIHISQKDLEVLFGPGYKLTPIKELQPGQFAAQETVTLIGPKGSLNKVRILGPVRLKTQVEISRTDSFTLGINPPVRDSGDLDNTPGIIIVGPEGCLKLNEGVIIAARHIHFHTSDAQRLGIEDGDRLAVKIEGERGLILENVLARVSDKYRLEMHIDTDEANGAGVKNNDTAVLLIESERS